MFPILLGKNSDLEKRVKSLEDSGGGGSSSDEILVVKQTDSILDKTWQEIHDATLAIIKFSSDIWFIYSISIDDGSYILYAWNPEIASQMYITDSANGYPTVTHQ